MKSIRTAADLAINGAPPAYVEPIHVGRPNFGSREKFHDLVDTIFDRNWLTNNGPLVQEFEKRVADYHGVRHCVAMTNGTVALEIAIRALDLQGEVIIPSYTFIATAHALHWQEITPVFADIDPHTHNLDPAAVRRMITPRTTGIIGVHLWGRCAPVKELESIAWEHDLKLMFDAAHAFGCSYQGRMVGGSGECEVLSFHATKLFNTFEGGAVLTNSSELARKMCLMRNFGFSGMDNVIYSGTNGKMSEIAAAMGLVNLDAMEQAIATNRRNYLAYKERLADVAALRLLDMEPGPGDASNFQYVIVELDAMSPMDRDGVIAALHAENILARKYFWPGCHRMFPYRELNPHADLLLEHTNDVAQRVLVLPTGGAIGPEDIDAITSILKVCVSVPGD